jgi:ribonuclease HI
MVSQPQYLLFCNTLTNHPSPVEGSEVHGRWHFVLDRLDMPQRLEATDCEPSINPDRLALLSVVRGLEALDEPSQVNLVTTSRYVSRGLKYGLASWRSSGYQWEHFGVQRPVRNADLWQRVDRAMRYHGLSCRLLQAQAVGVAADEAELDKKQELVSAIAPPHSPRPAAGPYSPRWNPAASSQAARTRHDITPSMATWARRLLGANHPISPVMLSNWWEMAWSWFKWWRRRSQPRQAILGM